jgi:hypothetical protein
VYSDGFSISNVLTPAPGLDGDSEPAPRISTWCVRVARFKLTMALGGWLFKIDSNFHQAAPLCRRHVRDARERARARGVIRGPGAPGIAPDPAPVRHGVSRRIHCRGRLRRRIRVAEHASLFRGARRVAFDAHYTPRAPGAGERRHRGGVPSSLRACVRRCCALSAHAHLYHAFRTCPSRPTVLLDWSVGQNMLAGLRTDGALILTGASIMLTTALAPRLRDYVITAVLHSIGCLTALNLGDDVPHKPTRTASFVCAMIMSVAVAYKGERKRRENLLLSWRLTRSNAAAARARKCTRLRAGSAARGHARGCTWCGTGRAGEVADSARIAARDAEAARSGFHRAVRYICHEVRALRLMLLLLFSFVDVVLFVLRFALL